MKKFFLFLTGFVVMVGGVYYFTTAPFDGQWYASGILEENFGWYLQYDFDHGTYTLKGYPPLAEQGTYKIVKQNGQNYELELTYTNTETNEKITEKDTLNLSYDGITVTINGTVFTRQR